MGTPLDRNRYIIQPLPNPDGKRGYRLEIDEFIADNAMTNLFLLALAALQENSLKPVLMKDKRGGQPKLEPDWKNYYALAGIHNEPRENWDGYQNDPRWGYCSHGKETFPTWHRPYMLLYEVTIHEKMVQIANDFKKTDSKEGDKYLAAAARFRLPYWDVVMPRKERKSGSAPASIWACPELCAKEEVYVRKPAKPKELVPIDNPMCFFRFPDEDAYAKARRADLGAKMSGRYNTERTTRNAVLDLSIQEQAAMFATKLGQMLRPDQMERPKAGGGVAIAVNELRPWKSFATDALTSSSNDVELPHGFKEDEWSTIPGNSRAEYATTSLEGWHNSLHSLCGWGGGQIGNPAFAGYDPMFWMLHNNIDRILSLYQALYPNKWLTGGASSDPEAQLRPFRKDASDTCYKSNDGQVRNYWSPGFAVPGDKQLDAAAVRENVKKYLTDTYYWADTTNPRPGQLANWPKKNNLTASEALTGRPAPSTIPTMNSYFFVGSDTKPADTVIHTDAVLEAVHKLDTANPTPAFEVAPAAPEPTVMQTWNAHVRVRKFAFDGSFKVDFFIGRPDDASAQPFLVHKNEVGFVGIFASPDYSSCANCIQQREDDITVEDVVPLTAKLVEYVRGGPAGAAPLTEGTHREIADLEGGSVAPFLREQLHWRMSDLRGNLITGQEREARLEIIVASRTFESPNPGQLLGQYGPYVRYPEVTDNKAGGFGYTYPAASEL